MPYTSALVTSGKLMMLLGGSVEGGYEGVLMGAGQLGGFKRGGVNHPHL